MDILVVNGGERLIGEVTVSGSKNAALPLMAASILADGPCTIRGVPRLRDIATARSLLETMGVRCEGDGDLTLDAANLTSLEAPYDLVKTMRASTLVLGPLVARHGFARVSLPGGCAIGARPIDLHLSALEALGAEIKLVHGYVEAKASGLRGGRIAFEIPSVGATENAIMAAALADGETVIVNPAREPEIVALADFLRAMGADIQGDGGGEIRVRGVKRLQGASVDLIPDRLETGTFMAAAGMTRGNILLRNVRMEHLKAAVEKFRQIGLVIESEDGGVRCSASRRLKAADIKTQPHPGFPTDLQAQFMAMMTIADGISVIKEVIFENRFMHVLEMQRMGAQIKVEGHTAVVNGVSLLSAADVMATDIRAGAGMILCALAAEGRTTVHRVYHIDRGYERIEEKLRALGADVTRDRE